MCRTRAALLAALLLVACSHAADEVPGPAASVVSRLDAQHDAAATEPSEGASAREARSGVGAHPPGAASTDVARVPTADVERVAADAVIRLLEDEGLLALDIATAVDRAEGPKTTIVTTVLYGTGRSHPQEASYLVELETGAGTWTVASIAAAS